MPRNFTPTIILTAPATCAFAPAAHGQSVQPLPAPPLLERLLFESPLPLSIALILLGLFAGYLLLAAGKRPLALIVDALAFAAAIAVYVLASVVTTDRERLIASTATLVNAAATADSAAVDALTLDTATFITPLSPNGFDKPAILRFVDADMRNRYAVKSHDILETHAALDSPTTARTQVRVHVQPQGSNFPIYSWWRIDWQRPTPDADFKVRGVQSLWINALDGPLHSPR